MKPVNLKTIPPDPCDICIVKAICKKECSDKKKFAKFICDKYFGEELHIQKNQNKKNASVLTNIFYKNMKYHPHKPFSRFEKMFKLK